LSRTRKPRYLPDEIRRPRLGELVTWMPESGPGYRECVEPRAVIYLDCPVCGLAIKRDAAPDNGSIICPDCSLEGLKVGLTSPGWVALETRP
jgi:hypothetical protein